MTDLETLQETLARREALPTCWTGAARELSGAAFAKDVRPWNWLELGEHEAEKLWAYLTAFVEYFNARYGERATHRIPPCWAEHGGIVEELTTLAFARWQAFSSLHASIGGAQYWHSYTLPAFLERLHAWLGPDALYCQQGRHREREQVELDTVGESRARTEAIRDDDLWLRLDADEVGTPSLLSLVPFVERSPL